jgi:hypothetical protein
MGRGGRRQPAARNPVSRRAGARADRPCQGSARGECAAPGGGPGPRARRKGARARHARARLHGPRLPGRPGRRRPGRDPAPAVHRRHRREPGRAPGARGRAAGRAGGAACGQDRRRLDGEPGPPAEPPGAGVHPSRAGGRRPGRPGGGRAGVGPAAGTCSRSPLPLEVERGARLALAVEASGATPAPREFAFAPPGKAADELVTLDLSSSEVVVEPGEYRLKFFIPAEREGYFEIADGPLLVVR